MTNIKYSLLFTIELLHKFFTSQLCPDFTIVPAAQTAALLQGYKMVAKQYEHQLYAGIQTDSLGKPFPLPAEGAQLTFFLQLKNPLFFNYTNLPFTHPPGKLYYFTNRNNTISNGKQFLSQQTDFDNARTYTPGDIATDSGIVYQSVRTSTGVTPAPGNFWVAVDTNRYLSENDAVQWMPAVSAYQFSTPQAAATVEVTGFNPAAPLAYSTVVLSKTIPFTKPVTAFELNLSVLPPGKYKLNVNGAVQIIYLNDELSTNKAFAVIDLYNESTLPAGYKLLDAGTLLSPLYSIYFLNRATIWKYALTSASGTISDNAGVFNFSAPAPHTVNSLLPIPLREKALSLTLAVGAQEYTPIACASPQRLSKFINGVDTYYCSEIFLNY